MTGQEISHSTQEVESLRALVRQEVQAEHLRVAQLVSQRDDEPEFYRLEARATQLTDGTIEKKKILSRLRRLGVPTQGQIARRRIFGIGLVAAISAFTLQQGIEAHTAVLASQDAFQNLGPHIGSALSHVHVDVFDLGKTFTDAGKAVNDVITSTVNTVGTAFDHAVKTAEGIGADTITLLARPWRKPRRRGRLGI